MDILCVLTDSHKKLFDNFFIKTIPSPEKVIVKKVEVEGDGHYKSKSWQTAVNSKTKHVVSYLEKVEDSTIFLFSDVDIQFFAEFSFERLEKELIDSQKDILFQKEKSNDDSYTINSGFYIAKSSENLLSFFLKVLESLNNSEVKSDQKIINMLLADSNIKWGFLPFNYYAWSHGFPPPITVYCHHANHAGKINKKINQMKFVRAYVEGGYIKKKLLHILSKINVKLKILKRNFI